MSTVTEMIPVQPTAHCNGGIPTNVDGQVVMDEEHAAAGFLRSRRCVRVGAQANRLGTNSLVASSSSVARRGVMARPSVRSASAAERSRGPVLHESSAFATMERRGEVPAAAGE